MDWTLAYRFRGRKFECDVQADVGITIKQVSLGFCITTSVKRKDRNNTLVSPWPRKNSLLSVTVTFSHELSLFLACIGLPDAFKPAERDHRNSRFGFPSCCSKGLCPLSLFCGKVSSEFVPKVRQVQALWKHNARVGHSLTCLWADNEWVHATIAGAWPVKAIQCVLCGIMWFMWEVKGKSSTAFLPLTCASFRCTHEADRHMRPAFVGVSTERAVLGFTGIHSFASETKTPC